MFIKLINVIVLCKNANNQERGILTAIHIHKAQLAHTKRIVTTIALFTLFQLCDFNHHANEHRTSVNHWFGNNFIMNLLTAADFQFENNTDICC